MSRGQYIRLCVEVDITKPLLSKFQLNGRVLGIQYEGLRQICFKCGTLGHKDDKCPVFGPKPTLDRVISGEPLDQSRPLATPKVPTEGEQYGAWMLVQRPPRRQPPKHKNIAGKRQGSCTDGQQGGGQNSKATDRRGKDKSQPQNQEPISRGSRFDILNLENHSGDQGKFGDEESSQGIVDE